MVIDATGCVVTVNVNEVEPAGIVAEVGMLAAVLVVLRVTVTPPAGASPFSFTVP